MGNGCGDFDEPCSNCGRKKCDGCKGVMTTLEWALEALGRLVHNGVVVEGVTQKEFHAAMRVYQNNHWKAPQFWSK